MILGFVFTRGTTLACVCDEGEIFKGVDGVEMEMKVSRYLSSIIRGDRYRIELNNVYNSWGRLGVGDVIDLGVWGEWVRGRSLLCTDRPRDVVEFWYRPVWWLYVKVIKFRVTTLHSRLFSCWKCSAGKWAYFCPRILIWDGRLYFEGFRIFSISIPTFWRKDVNWW